MSDDDNAKVDPRFDPAFQRGFDPSVPIEEYVPPRQPRSPQPVATPAAAQAAAPAATRAAVTETVPARVLSTSPAVTATSATAAAPRVAQGIIGETDQEAPDERFTDAGLEVAPSRNPFLLFLGIIAVALVAAGVWLFVQSGQAFNSAEVRSQGDYMSLDATIHSAPFIALLGAATAIGILFYFAHHYRRRC